MRQKLIDTGLIALGVALGVTLVELPALLGRVDYRFIAGGMEARVSAPAPQVHAPHQHISTEQPGDLVDPLGLVEGRPYRIDFHADRRGFRNPVDLDRADVAIIGDSFVENALLGDSEILTSQLSARLGGQSVLGFGRSGFGPIAELEVLRSQVLPLHPRVVVWLFFEGNDLFDILATARPRPPTFQERSFVRNTLVVIQRGLAAILPGDGGTDRDADRGASRRCVPKCRAGDCAPLYFGFRAEPLDADGEDSLAIAFGILTEAERLIEAAGAKLIVAFAPVKFRVYRSVCENSLSTELQSWNLNDLPERFRMWAGANGGSYVDLTAPLQRAAGQGEQVYFSDDTHWNARANAIAADVLADLIRDSL